MVIYLDASALIKLYTNEEHSDWTRRRVDRYLRSGGIVATSTMGYVEARAAFARAHKRRPAGRRISEEFYHAALSALDADARERFILRSAGGGGIIERAVRVAHEHALRGYDAVHLATALLLDEELRAVESQAPAGEVLILSFDDELHDAAVNEGVAHERPDRIGGKRFASDGGSDEGGGAS